MNKKIDFARKNLDPLSGGLAASRKTTKLSTTRRRSSVRVDADGSISQRFAAGCFETSGSVVPFFRPRPKSGWSAGRRPGACETPVRRTLRSARPRAGSEAGLRGPHRGARAPHGRLARPNRRNAAPPGAPPRGRCRPRAPLAPHPMTMRRAPGCGKDKRTSWTGDKYFFAACSHDDAVRPMRDAQDVANAWRCCASSSPHRRTLPQI